MIDVVTREDLEAKRDLRDVALAKHKGCIIEVIRRKPKLYYWRKGRRCSATTFGNAGDAARNFLSTADTATAATAERSPLRT